MKKAIIYFSLIVLSINIFGQDRATTTITKKDGTIITTYDEIQQQEQKPVLNKPANAPNLKPNKTFNKANELKTNHHEQKKDKLAPSECTYCERKMNYGEPFYYNSNGLKQYYSDFNNVTKKNYLDIQKLTKDNVEYRIFWMTTIMGPIISENIFCSKICAIKYCSALLNSY